MRGHNIYFHSEIRKSIFELSSIPHLIGSSNTEKKSSYSEETDDGEDTTTLCKNVLGTAIGMLMFRESLRGTCGETVYRCWRDIEAWRHIKDDARRIYWKHAIKTKYMHQGSQSEVKGRLKIIVFQGSVLKLECS